MPVTDTHILEASRLIAPHVLRTPTLYSDHLSRHTGAECFLKLENRQHTGSFKLRGALNKVLGLASADPSLHIVTASTGNHGLGVARALQITGMSGTVYVPDNVAPAKIEALQAYPIEVIRCGAHALETELYAKKQAEAPGKIWVSPYNDPDIIAGQGTVGLELTVDQESLAALYITVGGGGLISGVATWMKAHVPDAEIIGCLPERSPEMQLSVEAGEIVHLEHAEETLSDGSAGGCEDGSITFPICQKLVDRFILVTEEEIADAMHRMQEWHDERIEGAAGVAFAAMYRDGHTYQNKSIAAILCGGNVRKTILGTSQ